MFGKIFIFLLGVLVSYSYSVYALTTATLDDIAVEQEYALKYLGMYDPIIDYDKNIKINTYEGICKGYYVVEETDTAIRSYGFGDLAENYTYLIDKPYAEQGIATSTDPILGTDKITNDNSAEIYPANAIVVPTI